MIWVLAFLMVSNLRYFSFKELNLSKRKPFNLFILVILSMIVIIMEPTIMLFLFVLAYVFSGPVNLLIAWHKKRALKRMEPVPEKEVGFHE
jgi:CDP-diacylglycerol--serine O-phosphatidyltransferase